MKAIVLQKVKTELNSQFFKRFLTMFLCLFVVSIVSLFANATSDMGTKALNTVTTQVSAYVPYVQNLIYAIAGVVAVIGAINVYMKMNNGDQDVSKSIMMLVGACLFLVAAATALPKFFGVG